MLIDSARRLARNGQPNINVNVNNVLLEQVPCVKYLGVYIDCNLKWTHHIDHVVSAVNRRIGFLNRVRPVLSVDSLNLIVKAFIFPQFDYCDLVWSNASKSNVQRLDVLLNRIGKIVLRVPTITSSSFVLNTLGQDSLAVGRWT